MWMSTTFAADEGEGPAMVCVVWSLAWVGEGRNDWLTWLAN